MSKEKFEAAFIRFAAWLLDRNVQRSMVVSRRDNNWLSEAVYELRKIAQRIEREYRN